MREPNPQSPIANRQSPIPNRQSPIANRQSPIPSRPFVIFITLMHCFTSGVGDSPVTLKADFSLAFSAITFTIF
ncbi:MAG: hypothetical protein RIM23_11065 [Coleofasciculus sp. G3-WIS-01]